MLFVTWPSMVVALVPVIVIEIWIISRKLKVTGTSIAGPTIKGNIVSTVVGIPLTWLALLAVEIMGTGGAALGLNTPVRRFLSVTVQAPWLPARA
jgi:hypothetical protein